MNFCPPNPGFTDITSTKSTSRCDRLERARRSRRTQDDAGFDAQPLDGRDAALGVRQHFDVHRQHVCAGLDETRGISIGIGNHQVNVERQLRHPFDSLHHGLADADVRHEVAVHHVDMDQVGSTAFGGGDGGSEGREVCRQNGRREADRSTAQWLISSEIGSPAAIWNPAAGAWRRTMPAGTPGYGSSPTTETRKPRVRSNSTARDPVTPIRSGIT